MVNELSSQISFNRNNFLKKKRLAPANFAVLNVFALFFSNESLVN